MGLNDQLLATDPGAADLDAARVDAAEFPARNAPVASGTRERKFQAVFRRVTLEQIHRHGKETTEVEICGVLVGNVYRDASGPWLYIESSIRGDAAEGHAAQVTFKAQTWEHIQREMDTKHPDQRIVGWYHTHPGFGIFLSGMDLFIQDNFFNLPWQVAFVYDPIGGDEGSFMWRGGKSEREPFLVDETVSIEDSWALAQRDDQAAKAKPAPVATNDAGAIDRLDAWLHAINPAHPWVVAALVLVITLVLAGLGFAMFSTWR
ncbi:MAG: Mov34/MPN/PAD-1 family protein [Tepidisphaeraceae bacterium]